MRCDRINAIVGAALGVMGAWPAAAQTFQNYSCADGTKFILAFYEGDTRAFAQVDGRPLTLAKRIAVSGMRYSAADVTVRIGRDGAVTLWHAKRPVTACSLL
jgi:membrane-bound inhibitor of C-type lysozyme